MHEIDVLIFNCMNWYFDLYIYIYMHVIDYYYYYYYYYYCMLSHFKFLFLHEALVAMYICNALARLNFFNRGRWGCGIYIITKFGLEWDSLEDGYHFFLGRRRFFWEVYGCISRIKRKIMVWIIFFGKEIHAWESF